MTSYLVEKYGKRLRSTLIEVEVRSATATVFKLPDSEILREKMIVGCSIPNNAADTATSPIGRPLVSNQVIGNAWLSMKVVNDDVIDQHPLLDFLVDPTGSKEIQYMEYCNFNPQKSEITLGVATDLALGESFALVFYYVDGPAY